MKHQNRLGALAQLVEASRWIDMAAAGAPRASLCQGNLGALRWRIATTPKLKETPLRDAVAAAGLAVRLPAAGETNADQAARQLGRTWAYNEVASWHTRQPDQRAALAARRDAQAAARAAELAPALANHQDALCDAHSASGTGNLLAGRRLGARTAAVGGARGADRGYTYGQTAALI